MIINGKRYKGLQAYKEKGKDSFLYVHLDMPRLGRFGLVYDAYAGLTEETRLPNCASSVSNEWLLENAREMSFKKLPVDVQKHLIWYVS
jgi:hypothetical protein